MRLQLLFACLFAGLFSYAQSTQNIDFERKGFVFGFALGGGALWQKEAGNTETYSRLAYPNWKLGWMVNPKCAVLLHAPGSSYFSSDGERAFEGILPSVQYFIGKKAWVLGGAGLSMDIRPFFKVNFKNGAPDDFYFGYGACVGSGVKLFRKGNRFALDLSGRVFYGNVDAPPGRRGNTVLDVMVGFTWY